LASCPASLGAGCAAAAGGVLLTLWGEDQISAGSRAVVTGQATFTLGAHLISEVTGISKQAAELWYAVPGITAGSGPILAASAESRQLALQYQNAIRSQAFTPKGILPTEEVMNSPQVQNLIRALQADGTSAAVAYSRAQDLVRSGSTMIVEGIAASGSTLIKISPIGVRPTDYTPFWMSAQEARAVAAMSPTQAARHLGLPTESLTAAMQNGGFEFYSITVKPGQTAIVFSSKIAPTEQAAIQQAGGATQVLIPGRAATASPWTAPVKIDPKQLRSGG